MTPDELDYQQGRLAGYHDRRDGRSYAECGPDVVRTAWHRGYRDGWTACGDDMAEAAGR
jgi:hypothetical protein